MVEIGTRLGIPYVSGQDKNTSSGRTLEVALSGGVVEGGFRVEGLALLG